MHRDQAKGMHAFPICCCQSPLPTGFLHLAVFNGQQAGLRVRWPRWVRATSSTRLDMYSILSLVAATRHQPLTLLPPVVVTLFERGEPVERASRHGAELPQRARAGSLHELLASGNHCQSGSLCAPLRHQPFPQLLRVLSLQASVKCASLSEREGRGAEAACKERAVLGEKGGADESSEGITHRTGRASEVGAEKGSMHGGSRLHRKRRPRWVQGEGAQRCTGRRQVEKGSTGMIDSMLIRGVREGQTHSAAGKGAAGREGR